jgi:hypothetical protein
MGAMNAGRPMVLEGGTKWAALTINPEDAQMLESRGFSVEEICRFFGVPPFMIGHTEKTTSWGTGLEQQTLGFQKFTLRRRLKRIEQALEKQLLTPQDRATGVTSSSISRGCCAATARRAPAFYREPDEIGWMTINEVRALENLPPVEGGDVPRMQSQNVPITEAGAAAAAGAVELRAMGMKTKDFALQVKNLGDDGSSKGYGSVFGVRDSYRERSSPAPSSRAWCGTSAKAARR